jgi:hypothetical protein
MENISQYDSGERYGPLASCNSFSQDLKYVFQKIDEIP